MVWVWINLSGMQGRGITVSQLPACGGQHADGVDQSEDDEDEDDEKDAVFHPPSSKKKGTGKKAQTAAAREGGEAQRLQPARNRKQVWSQMQKQLMWS